MFPIHCFCVQAIIVITTGAWPNCKEGRNNSLIRKRWSKSQSKYFKTLDRSSSTDRGRQTRSYLTLNYGQILQLVLGYSYNPWTCSYQPEKANLVTGCPVQCVLPHVSLTFGNRHISDHYKDIILIFTFGTILRTGKNKLYKQQTESV